jgi:hypothetical protein
MVTSEIAPFVKVFVNTAASQREKKEEKKEKALMFFDRVVQ